jgi:signal transduction histidine kinase
MIVGSKCRHLNGDLFCFKMGSGGRHDLRLRGAVNRTINRAIDISIGLAVKTYAAQKALEIQQRREEHLTFVAHDLRSPLAAIAMAARLLEEAVPHVGRGQRAAMLLETMHRNVTRLNSLVVRVVQEEANLKTRVNESVERREVNLRELVEALVKDLRTLADDSGLKLVNEIPEGLTAFADPGMRSLIFQNLISNAIDYTPDGKLLSGRRRQKGRAASNAGSPTTARGFRQSVWRRCSTNWRPTRTRKAAWGSASPSSNSSSKRTAAGSPSKANSAGARRSDSRFLRVR